MENIHTRILHWFSEQRDISSYEISSLLALNYFEEELVDSFGILALIMFIEEEFQITFTEDHFQERRFSNINGLVEIIKELQDAL
jgi:acyl carrier protein